jgi:hypothetical protein
VRLLLVAGRVPPYACGTAGALCRAAMRSLKARGHVVFLLTAQGRRHQGGEGVFPLLEPGLDHGGDPLEQAFEGGFFDRRRRFYTGGRNRRVVRKIIRDLQPDVVSPWDLWGYSYAPAVAPLELGVPVVAVQLEPWLTNAWLEGARVQASRPGASVRDRLRRYVVKRLHARLIRRLHDADVPFLVPGPPPSEWFRAWRGVRFLALPEPGGGEGPTWDAFVDALEGHYRAALPRRAAAPGGVPAVGSGA